MLYVDYWTELLTDSTEELDHKCRKYVEAFHKNLMEGTDIIASWLTGFRVSLMVS